jgi:hypothetical protein
MGTAWGVLETHGLQDEGGTKLGAWVFKLGNHAAAARRYSASTAACSSADAPRAGRCSWKQHETAVVHSFMAHLAGRDNWKGIHPPLQATRTLGCSGSHLHFWDSIWQRLRVICGQGPPPRCSTAAAPAALVYHTPAKGLGQPLRGSGCERREGIHGGALATAGGWSN